MHQGSRIKIAFLHFSRSNYSGGQKTIFRLIQNLDLNVFQPIFITQRENVLFDKLSGLNIQCEIVQMDPILEVQDKQLLKFKPLQICKVLGSIPRYKYRLSTCLENNFVDIVWCENIRIFLTSYLAIRHSLLPVIWNIWSEERGKLARMLYLIATRLTDAINYEYSAQGSVIFGFTKDYKFIKNKSYVLYTGVTEEHALGSDIASEFSTNKNDVIFFMASNIYPIKGQLDLVKAMLDIHETIPKAKLFLAGAPLKEHPESEKYFRKLQELIVQSNSQHYIKLLGWRKDIVDLILACDVYVSTSYSEGMPDSIREAMRLGKPVIAANVGGIGELVGNDCGLLYSSGDINRLKELMVQLYNSSHERTRLGNNGREKIQKYFSNKAYAHEFGKMVINTLKNE